MRVRCGAAPPEKPQASVEQGGPGRGAVRTARCGRWVAVEMCAQGARWDGAMDPRRTGQRRGGVTTS